MGAVRSKAPKPSFTHQGDWVWLNQQLSDRGYRYYSAVRSFIFDADEDFEVDLTDEVIAELLGKDAKSVSRARKDCYAAGVIEELHTWKESVRVEGKAKPEVRTFRRLVIHHEVPEDYAGPVNAYAEKKRVELRRAQEQKAARQAREAARAANRASRVANSSGTNVSGQTDLGKQRGPAGRSDRTVLSKIGTKLSEPGTELSPDMGSDQGEQVPYLPSNLPSHQPSTSASATGQSTTAVDGSMDGGSAEPTTAPVAKSSAARTGHSPSSKLDSEEERLSQARRRRAQKLLEMVQQQVPQWNQPHDGLDCVVTALVRGWAGDKIVKRLTADLAGTQSPGAVVTSRLRRLSGQTHGGATPQPGLSDGEKAANRAADQAAYARILAAS
ncbi:hypothetical protein DI005_20075 [Prauserella sp. PE36]|nr:hypothetical protein DI005_20075 [Prauserella sp. PE36]